MTTAQKALIAAMYMRMAQLRNTKLVLMSFLKTPIPGDIQKAHDDNDETDVLMLRQIIEGVNYSE